MKRILLFMVLVVVSLASFSQNPDPDPTQKQPDCIWIDTAYAVSSELCPSPPFNATDTCYFWRVWHIRDGIIEFPPTEDFIRRSKLSGLSEMYIVPSGFLLDKQRQKVCKAN